MPSLLKAKDAASTASAAPAQQAEAQGTSTPIVSEDRLPQALEAVLLTMDKPVSAAKLAGSLGLAGALPETLVQPLVDALNEQYDASDRSFRIEKVAGGYRILTLPEFAPPIAAAHGMQASTKLSRAAVETLAIVAYRQPITRADVEAIRGVACGEVLRTLLDKKLVTIAGRAEELGRPMLYGTTARFLEAFGLAAIKDLPKVGDLFPGLDEAALAPAGGGTEPADRTDTDQAQDADEPTAHDDTPDASDPDGGANTDTDSDTDDPETTDR